MAGKARVIPMIGEVRASSEVPFLLGCLAPLEGSGFAGSYNGSDSSAGRRILSLSTASITADFLFSQGSSASARTDEGDVTILVHGEIHNFGPSSPADWILHSYLDSGSGFVGELHGSFILVVVDARSDRLYVVTDPMNSRKVYWRQRGRCVWIANCHAFSFLPLEDTRPNELGVAHYLVNGFALRGRTLFQGVQVLDRGAVHRLHGDGWESERYWSYQFRPSARKPRELRAVLKDLLLTAVRRRVEDRPRVVLSLSGGYDSPAILGALHRLGVPDVRCFSYASSGEGEGGDAAIARRLCERLGYAHTVLTACRDPLLIVLGDNVTPGNGLTRLVVETDAWRAVGSTLADSPETVVFVGDECLGWTDADLRSEADALRVLGIRGWGGVKWLKQWMPREVVQAWNRSIPEDLRDMVSRLPDWDDLHDLKDVLYFEERLPRLLAWRETFAGGYCNVRYPLLDREILRFIQEVPVALRRGKKLFRDVACESFPSVFEQERAAGTGSMVRRWADRVVREESVRIRDLIESEPSPLDRYVPAESLLHLLEICGRSDWRRNPVRRTVRKARRMLGNVGGPLRRRPPPLLPPSHSVLLMRSLFLRIFLKERFTAEAPPRWCFPKRSATEAIRTL